MTGLVPAGLRSRPANERSLLRAAIVLGVVTTALVAVGSASPDSRIGEKQAEARSTLARINRLGYQLDRATEAYNGATYRLRRTRASLRLTEHELEVARHDLRVSESQLAAGLRELYVDGPSQSTAEVLLGASSVDEVITALDTARQLSQRQTQLVVQVLRFKAAVLRRRARLTHERKVEERIVVERAATRARIARGLTEQRLLLASIRNEIVTLKREEAIYQARLAAEARARLAAEQLAQQEALRNSVVGASAEGPAGSNGFPSAAVVPPSEVGGRVVVIAMQYLGRPYVWDAAGPDAFDCSGLVMYVFAQVGISLPHFAAAQWNYGVYVPREDLEPGDLVFFEDLGHVGIYVGNGDYIQAPHPGDVVKITPLSDPWSSANYYGAKRIA